MRTRQLTILLIAASFIALPIVAAAGHKNYGYNSWPDQYARIAVKQAQKNYQSGCGFHGNRWTSNYNDHRRWAARKPARGRKPSSRTARIRRPRRLTASRHTMSHAKNAPDAPVLKRTTMPRSTRACEATASNDGPSNACLT